LEIVVKILHIAHDRGKRALGALAKPARPGPQVKPQIRANVSAKINLRQCL
jgi:hypothetical protein